MWRDKKYRWFESKISDKKDCKGNKRKSAQVSVNQLKSIHARAYLR